MYGQKRRCELGPDCELAEKKERKEGKEGRQTSQERRRGRGETEQGSDTVRASGRILNHQPGNFASAKFAKFAKPQRHQNTRSIVDEKPIDPEYSSTIPLIRQPVRLLPQESSASPAMCRFLACFTGELGGACHVPHTLASWRIRPRI